MKRLQQFAIAGLLAIAMHGAHAQGLRATDCQRLASVTLPKTTLSLTQSVAAGELTGITAVPSSLAKQLPAFCRVAATIEPSYFSQIKIEVWLPANWNGRLQGVGNGGLAGSISYAALATALKDGYAATSTDTGHTGSPVSGEWALKHPEKIADFGDRAVHEMTVAAKAIVRRYYGRPQHHSYWNGCSTGGNQALHEAQRYPQDYDGILAGAPANYMTHLQVGGLWISHAIHKDPGSFIATNKLAAINKAVLAACDATDGLKDGIVDDPRACTFDTAQLKCSGAETDQCLTAAQIAGLNKVYTGAKNPRTGAQLFPGYTQGSELEWSSWIVGVDSPPKNRQHAIAENFFKYLVFDNAAWQWETFDFDKDVTLADQRAGVVNSIDPDLRAFNDRGGKLLQYHGWYDSAIAPLNSINYFSLVQNALGDTRAFYRLFMIPGMAHCGGGPGISEFDKMNVIVRWVEEGKAPDVIIASRKASDGTEQTQTLCPYPLVARRKDSGSRDASESACALAPEVVPRAEVRAKPRPATASAPRTESRTQLPVAPQVEPPIAPRAVSADQGTASHYEMRRDHDPEGTGKFYMGREIAQVMGPGGALWLERPEREDEEQPVKLLEALALKGGETVVDFGAGSGYYTFRLAKAVGPRGAVIAVDIEPKMLEFIRQRAARENLINVGLLQSTETDPKLPANRVDWVLLVDVYHELSFPFETMTKIRDALKPDGRVALVEYRKEDPAVRIKAVHKMSAAQAIAEMEAVGLAHVETIDHLPLQHLLVFRRAERERANGNQN